MKTAHFVAPLVVGCISAKYGEDPAVEEAIRSDSGVPESADPSATDQDTGEQVVTLDVIMGPVQDCEDPRTETQYTEQAISMGVDTEWFDPDSPGGHEDGPSLSMADVNQDGLYDWAVFRMEGGSSNMYMGEVGGYRLWPAELYPGRAGIFVDLNHDGWLDLLVGGALPFVRLQAEGDTWSSGEFPALDPDNEQTASIIHNFTLGDFDSNGSVDIYAVRTASPFG